MSNVITGTPLRVCPECASAMTETSELVGGSAECKACKWSGKREDLLVVPFSSAIGSPVELFMTVRSDLRALLSTNSIHFLRFLVKWGFLNAVQRGGQVEVTSTETAMRYMNTIAQAVLLAVLTERQKIEKEKVHG